MELIKVQKGDHMLSNILEQGFSKAFKDGYITKDIRVGEGLVLTLRVLSQDEMIAARMSIPEAAKKDVLMYSAVETIEILSRAIVRVNGEDVSDLAEKEAVKEESARPRELAIRTIKSFLLKFPTASINELEEFYNSLVKKDYEALEAGGLFKEIENF